MDQFARQQLLEKLAKSEGFETTDELIEGSIIDSVSPGICSTPGCDGTMEVEPDQDRGWCEVCGNNSVVSALVLADLI
jgi:hypothetical protein